MTDESVFFVSEIWLSPGKFDDFKKYRLKTIDILQKYNAEYVYHGHPFEWFRNPDKDALPTGVEIFHFKNSDDAGKAFAELNDPLLKEEELKIFDRLRSYKSRFAISDSWNKDK